MNRIIKGRTFKIGDNITAYKIISQARWTACGTDVGELGKWAFEPSIPEIKDVPYGFRDLGYKIVVGGTDFGGGGKSNDHPVLTLKEAGVKLLIAESFSRIYFRNAINLGLPAIQCPGISEFADNGHELSAHLITGEITNLATGKIIRGEPLSDYIIKLVEAGGLLAYYRNNL